MYNQTKPFFFESYPSENLVLPVYSPITGHQINDIEYLNSMHSPEINELKRIIENECDLLEYNGSIMYDEYPDRLMFSKKCNDIYTLARHSCEYGRRCHDDYLFKDIIAILLGNEFYKRRRRRRRYY